MEDNVDISRAVMLDANSVAGTLAEIFAAEMTLSPAECAYCGRQSEIGSLLAFTRGPGIVLRCPNCMNVVLRMVMRPGKAYVDARGAAYLCVPLANP
jgi:hypothetical protein